MVVSGGKECISGRNSLLGQQLIGKQLVNSSLVCLVASNLDYDAKAAISEIIN